MSVWILAANTVGSFVVFCNLYVVKKLYDERYGKDFFLMWREEIEESQTTKFGKGCMRMFYFIHTAGSIVSWCKYKLTRMFSIERA